MKSKTILITGCSTGIGYHSALALKERGYWVFATCRREEDVGVLKGLGLNAFLMNVDDTHSIKNAVESIIEVTGGRIDVLINNAGYGQAGALEDISRDVLRQQFETNVFGLMDLTRLIIPIMRNQGGGRIINVSSILGLISLPFRGAYNASKYAVEGLSDTLRLELEDSKISVITIEPGPIESQFRKSAVGNSLKQIDIEKSFFKNQYETMLSSFEKKKNDSLFTCKPEAVIRQFIHAIESKRPKAKYPVTLPAYLLSFVKRCLSVRMLDFILKRVSKKELSSN